MIGPKAGVAKSIPPGEMVLGAPCLPYRTFMRCSGLFARLPELVERIRRLEREVKGNTTEIDKEVKDR
jgi:UDP-3-O-[3-hydroxymyristoyl] glucosamine N-acyltransferase